MVGRGAAGRMLAQDRVQEPIRPSKSLFFVACGGGVAEGTDDESPVVDRFGGIFTGWHDRLSSPQHPWQVQQRQLQQLLDG